MIPSLGALAAPVVAGMIPLALGNFVRDEGFRRDDGQLLAVMACGTPLCSVLLLAAIGAALLTSVDGRCRYCVSGLSVACGLCTRISESVLHDDGFAYPYVHHVARSAPRSRLS